MAILFYEKKKREIYLVALVAILILAFFFLWFKVFRNKEEEIPTIEPNFLERKEEKIKIDFKEIENQILYELEFFSPIFPFQENFGRKDPFVPYVDLSTTSTSTLPEE
ncbi:MAG: hypothetical protein U9Q96_00035 [Patescibacteria group bacterium]|nr:hypothetical protein [Patescibacteria group bacterium]